MHRVFVYGTLKRGFSNHGAWMKDFPCIGRFRTRVAFPLVVGGTWFSPYLIAEPGVGVPVFGEVFELDDRGLEILDTIEGTDVPNGYRRIGIAVEDAGGGRGDVGALVDAWTYVKDRAAIEGIHSGPMDRVRARSEVRAPRQKIDRVLGPLQRLLQVGARIEALLSIFRADRVPIVLDGDKFRGLITHIDLFNYLRRKMK